MNFINEHLPESDRELFFGPLDAADKFLTFSDGDDLAKLLVAVGKFPSLGQARKNGFAKPISPGFSKIKVGKTLIWVLNKFEGWKNEPD